MVEVKLSPLELDPLGALRRDPPRPPEHREPGYEEKFDYFTVFYDCFASLDRKWITFIGPPLRNLEPLVHSVLAMAFRPSQPKSVKARQRQLDRLAEVRIANTAARLPVLASAFQQTEIVVQPNLCQLFDGKKVLLTKNKDNELIWIRDWAYFYAVKHGCNAVLIYDNGSTKYDSGRLQETVAAPPGLDIVVVIDWPYKYGPLGLHSNIWDSDFSQYGMLEHARHRFLARADAVVNCDIDELIITSQGATIYDCVRRSRTGYLQFDGHWIENATLASAESRRHADFIYQSTAVDGRAETKWIVIPSRCGVRTQWTVHAVPGMDNDLPLAKTISLRHFRAITTNWKLARWRPERPGEHHVIDRELVEWLGIFEPT